MLWNPRTRDDLYEVRSDTPEREVDQSRSESSRAPYLGVDCREAIAGSGPSSPIPSRPDAGAGCDWSGTGVYYLAHGGVVVLCDVCQVQVSSYKTVATNGKVADLCPVCLARLLGGIELKDKWGFRWKREQNGKVMCLDPVVCRRWNDSA